MQIPVKDKTSVALTTEGPNPNVAAEAGQNLVDLGKGLVSLDKNFKDLRDREEGIRANTQFNKLLGDRHFEAVKDPDVWNAYEKTEKQINLDLEETSKIISDPTARMLWIDRAQGTANRKSSVIQMQLMKKQLEQSRVSTRQLVSQLTERYWNETPKEQALTEDEISRTIDEATVAQYFMPDAGYKYKMDTLKLLHTGIIGHDIQMNLSSPDPIGNMKILKGEFEKGAQGRYAQVPETERIKLYKDIDAGVEKAQKLVDNRIKNVLHATDKQATEMYWNGTLTDEYLEQNRNTLTASRYSALHTLMFSGMAPQRSNPDDFAKVMDFVADTSHSENEVVDYILKMQAENKISKDDAMEVSKMFLVPSDKDPISQMMQREGLTTDLDAVFKSQAAAEQASKDARNKMAVAWKMVKGYTKNNIEGWNIIKSMFGGDPERLAEGAKVAIEKDIRLNHPEINFLADIPNSVMSARNGLSEIWGAPSRAVADYIIQNGKVTPISGVKKGRQAGETVLYKGRKRIIKKILPDGKLELED